MLEINNKIAVDIEINGSGQQQINHYKSAFDSLRASVNNLSSPIANLGNNISKLTDSVNKSKEANFTINDSISKLKEGYDNAKSVIGFFNQAMAVARGATINLTAALTGGLSLLLTFGPELIKIISSFLQGNVAISDMVKHLSNLNGMMKSSNQDIAEQTTKLNVLYKAATNMNKPEAERLKFLAQLNKEYPAYFKNLTNEDVSNGNIKKSYDALTKSIYDNARAKAALNIMTEKASKILDAEYQIEKIKTANFNEKKRYEAQMPKTGQFGYRGPKREAILEQQKKDSDKRAQKAIEEQQKIKQSLTNQIDFLTKAVGGTNKIAASLLTGNEGEIAASSNLNISGEVSSKSSLPKKNDKNPSEAEKELINSIARQAELSLNGYAKEIQATENHFAQLKQQFKDNKATVEQLEKERVATLAAINQKYQDDELKKLDGYEQQLRKISEDAGKSARQLAIEQIDEKYKTEENDLKEAEEASEERLKRLKALLETATEAEELSLQTQIAKESDEQNRIKTITTGLNSQKAKDKKVVEGDFDAKEAQAKFENKGLQQKIEETENSGHHSKALQLQIELLNQQHVLSVEAARKKGEATTKIDADYAKKKAALEDQLTASKIHAGDKFIDAALKNSKKDSAIYKAAFLAKKATSIADTIISTKRAVMDSFKAYASIPVIGQALGIAQAAFMAAQGAMSIADIAKQKPGFASGGQFRSDGKGALLSGYSRTDDTNAYLRSGEAVVVSEAMRNPWARNLVSAINVAHGGRDFSVPNSGSGYAMGGIYTDGGNANRYYSQPANDVKDLANTLAYQMINNFPPVYVDVKDINTQQSILAKTVDRVNL